MATPDLEFRARGSGGVTAVELFSLAGMIVLGLVIAVIFLSYPLRDASRSLDLATLNNAETEARLDVVSGMYGNTCTKNADGTLTYYFSAESGAILPSRTPNVRGELPEHRNATPVVVLNHLGETVSAQWVPLNKLDEP